MLFLKSFAGSSLLQTHIRHKIILLLAFFIMHNLSAIAQTIVFADTNERLQIGHSVSILEDKTGAMGFDEVIASDKFIQSEKDVPNLGISNSVFWVKFQVQNTSSSELNMELAYPIMDKVVLYNISPNGTVHVEAMGEDKPFKARKNTYQTYVFDLNIAPYETRTYLMKVHSGEQILLPLYIATPEATFESFVIRDIISGIYFGIIMAMFLYNIFLFFTVKDISYLYYVLYILAVGLTQATLQGYGFRYLWPGSPTLATYSTYLFGALSGLGTILFTRAFLQTRKYLPKLDYGLIAIFIIGCISIVVALAGQFNLSYSIIDLNAGLGSLFVLIVAVILYRRNHRSAKFFLAAWSIFLASVIVFVLKDFGVLPYNTFTNYALQLGSALEVILLSFALADRINTLKKEKAESQAKALLALKQNEDIIKEQNISLEARVQERTSELQKSNEELNTALVNLKEAQAQLVNAEKMASLGQLTAGIAHEINNPINYVASNISPLRLDISDLLSLLSKFDNILSHEDFKHRHEEIQEIKDSVDIEYLIQEIDLLLGGIGEGARRTAEIVKGLRNFSRLDEDVLKKANLNEGIDSTLTLLKPNMAGMVEVKKIYKDYLEIECFPGKLNQVFMNILTNAIQAMLNYKYPEGKKPTLTIASADLGENVEIRITDNGPGMSEEVKKHIFEPFYTTKDVGEGTGLGLSIVYTIIEKHEGKIEVETAPGQGSTFIISLPKVRTKDLKEATAYVSE